MAFLKKISVAQTDDELLARYKAGGEMETLGTLYNRYMDLVYGVCLKYFRDPEQARDSVMAIFEELVTKLKKYEVENFKGWLYQLAKNHCLMKLRSEKSKPVNVSADLMHLPDNWHPDDAAVKESALNSMSDCLAQLPAEQRQAVALFYLEDKCYKEIAEQTGTDISRVRSYIQNGRRNLRICMEKQAQKSSMNG